MIQLASSETTPLVYQMWKVCFGDSEAFMDIYFSQKYVEENTLIYFDGETAVASLQMLPGEITYYGERIPYYYMSGLCTLPAYRKKGYMALLIHEAHRIMQEREIPLAILIPAEEWLYDFYEKYDYQQVFEGNGSTAVSLCQLMRISTSLEEAYERFNTVYSARDFCVQKSFSDFSTIVEEAQLANFPDTENLSAMARITNLDTLLTIYARKNPEKSCTLSVTGESYSIADGKCKKQVETAPQFTFTLREMCRVLFGYKTNELGEEIASLFPQQEPTINFMLE